VTRYELFLQVRWLSLRSSQKRVEPFSNASSESTTAIETSIAVITRGISGQIAPRHQRFSALADVRQVAVKVIEVVEFHVRNHWTVAEAAAIKPR
jgi:hypothetical protein